MRVIGAVATAVVLAATTAMPAWGSYADTASVTSGTVAAGSLGTPSLSCAAMSASVGSITFNWPAVSGATSYTVHYGLGGASTATTTATSYTLTGLISGGKFSVQATRYNWQSGTSAVLTYSILLAVISTCS